MPICDKTLKNRLSQYHKNDCPETWHVSFGGLFLHFYINDDLELTSTYFYGKVNSDA